MSRPYKIKNGKDKLILSEDKQKKIAKTGTPLKNPFHEKFAQLYSINLNGTASYLTAKKESGKANCTIETARSNSHKLLNDSAIKARITELTDQTAAELQISRVDILQGILDEIDANPFDAIELRDGELILKNPDMIPLSVKQCIKTVKQGKDGISITFYDRQKAREQLMKYLGMLDTDQNINVNFNLGDVLTKAHQRVQESRKSGKNIENAEYETIE